MKVVYISGPYRAKTEWQLVENIRRAEKAAIKFWQQGYAVICPHKNTSHFGGLCDDSIWLKGDLEILLRCDCVYMLPRWENSEGSRIEHEVAKSNNIEVIYDIPGQERST